MRSPALGEITAKLVKGEPIERQFEVLLLSRFQGFEGDFEVNEGFTPI